MQAEAKNDKQEFPFHTDRPANKSHMKL